MASTVWNAYHRKKQQKTALNKKTSEEDKMSGTDKKDDSYIDSNIADDDFDFVMA